MKYLYVKDPLGSINPLLQSPPVSLCNSSLNFPKKSVPHSFDGFELEPS